MDGPAVLGAMRERRAAMLATLRGLVEHESPSRDKRALDALASRLADLFASIGGEPDRIANPDGGDHLRIRFHRDAPSDAAPALVIAHFDTVWPLGTLARLPFRVEGDRAHGPGIFDMKASLAMIATALDVLRQAGSGPPRPVTVLLTSDEEIGSPTSRALIESEARRAAFVLVPEPPLPDGSLKTARKGVGVFTVTVTGRAAHAGVEPEKGANAIVELAHQVLAIVGLAAPSEGTSLNVGVIQGGTTVNVVPDGASARVDLRVTTMAEAERVEAALKALRSRVPGTSLRIEGGLNRPPMERGPASQALFERARAIGERLGLALTEGATGGASDGNFTAALGVPTLDGLGAQGAGAHAEHEHIIMDSMTERAALLAALLGSL